MFYFHGRRDRDFCIVSDPSLHINAHFIGKPHPGKKRDFTWVQSLSVLVQSSDPGPHSFYLAAKKTAKWDDSVDHLALWYDSHPISLPTNEDAMWQSPDGLISIKRTSPTNVIVVESKNKFEISATARPITKKDSDIHHYNITDDDCFAHLDLSFKFYDLSDGVDGVLGRTYRKDYVSRVNMTNTMPVVGGERDFVTSGLFATDCTVSKFNKDNSVQSTGGANKKSKGYSKMMCQSNPTGAGVLCSR
jgi:Root cap